MKNLVLIKLQAAVAKKIEFLIEWKGFGAGSGSLSDVPYGKIFNIIAGDKSGVHVESKCKKRKIIGTFLSISGNK